MTPTSNSSLTRCVTIREGVIKNIEITSEHFRTLFNNLPFEHFVYDAKKVNRLRQFAVSNTLMRKEVQVSPDFQALWERIKPKTPYRVEFETGKLIDRAVDALRRMPAVEKPRVRVSTGQIEVKKSGGSHLFHAFASFASLPVAEGSV